MGDMKKGKTPSIPDVPSFYEDPRFAQGLERLFGLGEKMTSFDFTGDLEPLQETIDTSPEMSRMYMEWLKGEMEPGQRQGKQDVVNQMVASGQEMGSTFGSTLGLMESDYQKTLAGAGAQFGIADINRAMQNRIQLFGTGLNVTSGATGFAAEFQALKNQFNLENYENIVAKSLYEKEKLGAGQMALAKWFPSAQYYYESQGYENVPQSMGTLDYISGIVGGALGGKGTGGQGYQPYTKTSPGQSAVNPYTPSNVNAYQDVGLGQTFLQEYLTKGGYGGVGK